MKVTSLMQNVNMLMHTRVKLFIALKAIFSCECPLLECSGLPISEQFLGQRQVLI